MERFPAKVVSDGRVTIPKDERDELGLSEGDKVWVQVEKRTSDVPSFVLPENSR